MKALLAILPFVLGSSSWAAEKAAEATFKDAQGREVGKATLTPTEKGVKITVDARGLEPGEHGIHVHEKGICEGPAFESAGPHFSAPGKQHGLENPKGPHSGDLPNLVARADGTAHYVAESEWMNLRAVVGGNGSAIIIHEKADDQITDPSGKSGDRVICGVVAPAAG